MSFWGYAPVDSAGCGAATVTHPGGPTLVVNQGDSVTINLHNNLAEPTSLDIGGQALESDRERYAARRTTKSYTFTATAPGTFLYQAGLTANGPQEAALGLYGALVVRPATAAGQAYDDAGSAFDVEGVLVLGELDPALTPANYAGFDMRNYAPKWGLINGLPYPSTTPIAAAADDTVLLRYLNAGSFGHSMSVLGANQTQLATDGHRFPADRRFVAETFGPGETADVLVHVPTTSAAGTKLTVFDGGISLFNNGKKTNLATARAFGGMMTFIEVGTSTGTPGGPFTNAMAFTAGILTAVIDDTDTGGDNVAAAEYFVDTRGGQRLRHAAGRRRRRLQRRRDRARDVDDAAGPGPRRPHAVRPRPGQRRQLGAVGRPGGHGDRGRHHRPGRFGRHGHAGRHQPHTQHGHGGRGRHGRRHRHRRRRGDRGRVLRRHRRGRRHRARR